jgi:hypothetical protein
VTGELTLVLIADKDKPQYALLALIPTLLFGGLDAYYLALEKSFRDSYNRFIDKLHERSLTSTDLYAVEATGPLINHFARALRSASVWPFYLTLLALVAIAKRLIV